jgi:hypothetical protein
MACELGWRRRGGSRGWCRKLKSTLPSARVFDEQPLRNILRSGILVFAFWGPSAGSQPKGTSTPREVPAHASFFPTGTVIWADPGHDRARLPGRRFGTRQSRVSSYADTRVSANFHGANIDLALRKGGPPYRTGGEIARILVRLPREIPFSTGTLRTIQPNLTVPDGKFYRSYREKMAYPWGSDTVPVRKHYRTLREGLPYR